MKKMILGALLMLAAACSGSQGVAESGHPRGLDICGSQFAACTNHNPGDFTACADRRRTCEVQCTGEEAERDTITNQSHQMTPDEAFSHPQPTVEQTAPAPETKPDEDEDDE